MAEGIKRELTERAQRVIMSAGALARGEVRPGGHDDVMLAARAFGHHERNMCSTESALADLGAVVRDMESDLATVASAASRLPVARAGLLATLDVACCDGNDPTFSEPSQNINDALMDDHRLVEAATGSNEICEAPEGIGAPAFEQVSFTTST